MSARYGPNAGRARNVAIVYSPMTMARVRNAPDRSDTRRFGRITRHSVRNHPAPRLCDASVNERTSLERRPTSTARYMYGSDSTVYPATSRTLLPRSELVSGRGGPLKPRMSPNTRTIGGITNGRSVMNSTSRRSCGRRNRTQNAVGTMSAMLTTTVITPITNEYTSVFANCGSARRLAYAERFWLNQSVGAVGRGFDR